MVIVDLPAVSLQFGLRVVRTNLKRQDAIAGDHKGAADLRLVSVDATVSQFGNLLRVPVRVDSIRCRSKLGLRRVGREHTGLVALVNGDSETEVHRGIEDPEVVEQIRIRPPRLASRDSADLLVAKEESMSHVVEAHLSSAFPDKYARALPIACELVPIAPDVTLAERESNRPPLSPSDEITGTAGSPDRISGANFMAKASLQ